MGAFHLHLRFPIIVWIKMYLAILLMVGRNLAFTSWYGTQIPIFYRVLAPSKRWLALGFLNHQQHRLKMELNVLWLMDFVEDFLRDFTLRFRGTKTRPASTVWPLMFLIAGDMKADVARWWTPGFDVCLTWFETNQCLELQPFFWHTIFWSSCFTLTTNLEEKSYDYRRNFLKSKKSHNKNMQKRWCFFYRNSWKFLQQQLRCPHILVEIILLKAAILDSMACSEDLE